MTHFFLSFFLSVFFFFFKAFLFHPFFVVRLLSVSFCVFMTGYLEKHSTPTVCRFVSHPDCSSLADVACAWSSGQLNRKLRETQVISESTTCLEREWLSDSGKFMIVFECLTIPQIHTPIPSGLYMVLCVSLPLVPGPGPMHIYSPCRCNEPLQLLFSSSSELSETDTIFLANSK